MTTEKPTSLSLVIPSGKHTSGKQTSASAQVSTMPSPKSLKSNLVKKSAPFSPSSRGSAMLKAALDHKASHNDTGSKPMISISHLTNNGHSSNNNNDNDKHNVELDNLKRNHEPINNNKPLKPLYSAEDKTTVVVDTAAVTTVNGYLNLNNQYLNKTINLFTGCATNNTSPRSLLKTNSVYNAGSGSKRRQSTRTGILGNQYRSTGSNGVNNRTYRTTRPRSDRVLFTNPLVSKKFEYEPTIYPIEQSANKYTSSLSKDQNRSGTEYSDGEEDDVEEEEDEDEEEDILDVIINGCSKTNGKSKNKSNDSKCKAPNNDTTHSLTNGHRSTTLHRKCLKRPISKVPHIFSTVQAEKVVNSDSSDSAQSNADEGSLFSPPKVAKIAPFYHSPRVDQKVSEEEVSDDSNSDSAECPNQQYESSQNENCDSSIDDAAQLEENCNTICATVQQLSLTQQIRSNNSFLYNMIAGGCNFIATKLSKLIY